MPRLDGTGPLGEGSMTGRGLGKCNPENTDAKVIYGIGRGGIPYGCGRGRMFGGGRNRFNRFGRRFVQGQNAENNEISILKEQIRKLENKINELEKRETK